MPKKQNIKTVDTYFEGEKKDELKNAIKRYQKETSCGEVAETIFESLDCKDCKKALKKLLNN